MRDMWLLHRRAVLILGGVLAALIVLLMITGVVVHYVTPTTRAAARADSHNTVAAPPSSGGSAGHAQHAATTSPVADDVARWNAMPAVRPAVCAAFPALRSVDRTDPATFAAAFATLLFTRDYATATRSQLLAWAQAEDAPLRTSHYPAADWSKVLVDSLTDLNWDDADQSPIPPPRIWQMLAAEHARDTVSEVTVRTDPQWETAVAGGYQPSDALMSVQDVSLRVTRHTVHGKQVLTSHFEESLAVQLGTSPQGGYAAAATNDYLARAVS